MIRFIDLTVEYWTDPEGRGHACCAFLDTVTDCFIVVNGGHVFDNDSCFDDLISPELATRLRGHVPEGFWAREVWMCQHRGCETYNSNRVWCSGCGRDR